ncbi:axoneme-associated protein [Lasius niger]|uniref:Axoneme-associated protein n=1 Tax=Lasius niger TaxID=67767 RepID=A0A0J7KJX0_LASNI|nr:axoneme-associated protein [Lasius niger]
MERWGSGDKEGGDGKSVKKIKGWEGNGGRRDSERVLVERLREEVEGKGLLPPSQTGFRKGLGTIDNVYVLNYLINRQVNRKKGKMAILFIDLKAAFDSVDRGILVEAMRERGVREGLVRRCKEVLEETVNMVGNKLWSGGVGMEGKRGNGKAARQISEMDVGGGEEDSRVYGKGGNAKGYVERESRVKGLKI